MGKFLCILLAISVIVFVLGLLGLISPATRYEPIANLANEGWMQPIIRYNMGLIIGGSIGIAFFAVFCAVANKGSEKR